MLNIQQKQTVISLLADIDEENESEGLDALFEHIHALENAVYLRGYSEGRDVGYEEGRDYGQQEGREEGSISGYENGYDAGYSVGYDAGYNVGMDGGY